MKKLAVLGAGFVTKPAVDYFMDRCGYEVIVTSINKKEAEKIIGGRAAGTAVEWSVDQPDLLDCIVSEVDLVMSMIPPSLHFPVAETCLKHRKNMITTSYISPQMEALDEPCRNQDVLILNEIGEDPGLDIMSTKRLIDQVQSKGGKVTEVTSYGAGLPSFEHNNNPFGYKFSWSPAGLISAAKTSAAYLEKGKKVEVPAMELFDHHKLITLKGLGSFETYPNRDCTKYLKTFGLSRDITFFRGLLRYPGWCKTMKGLIDLKLLDTTQIEEFAGKSYAEFAADLVNESNPAKALQRTAKHLNIAKNSEFIKKLNWLGYFSEQKIAIQKGTHADVLIELMTKKLSYSPLERDMVLISNEVIAEFANRMEQRVSTLLVKGEPSGDSAMSRAVSLPAAIASRLILEKKIEVKGVQRPTKTEIYTPVLEEMETFGYRFENKIIKTN